MKFLLVLESRKTVGSPPSRGAWIEIPRLSQLNAVITSPPSRGAWIEIPCNQAGVDIRSVAPLAGGVD